MAHWIGRWLIGVSILHTLFAIVVFHKTLLLIVQRGVFNVVGTDPMIAAVVWFVLCGAAMFVGGLAISALERATGTVPKSIGWCLLGYTLIGLTLMPASGFWLILPAAIAVLLKKTGAVAAA
jgi:Family of unknown function (DUF6463)